MAIAEWIAVRKALSKEIEVILMASNLGMDPRMVVGTLVDIWAWADDVTEDGLVPGISADSLQDLLRLPNGFLESMQKVGWIDFIDDPESLNGVVLLIPGFDVWMGNSTKRRLKRAKTRQADEPKTVRGRTKNGQSVDQKWRAELTKSGSRKVTKSSGSGSGSSSSSLVLSSSSSEQPVEGGEAAEGWSRFWSTYPRKSSEPASRAAYFSALELISNGQPGDDGVPLSQAVAIIQEAVELYAISEVVESGFALGAVRWIEEERWKDDPASWFNQKNGLALARHRLELERLDREDDESQEADS